MFGLGTNELILIVAIIILFFGAKKVPELSKSIGETIRYIRRGFNDESPPSQNKDGQSKS
jgi:sec-independent protein translocase protein TatA